MNLPCRLSLRRGAALRLQSRQNAVTVHCCAVEIGCICVRPHHRVSRLPCAHCPMIAWYLLSAARVVSCYTQAQRLQNVWHAIGLEFLPYPPLKWTPKTRCYRR